MNILVLGATGPLGRHIVEQALSDGHHVTALVREPGRLPAQQGLSEAVGDVLDPEAVAAAVGGHDAVISALGHSRPSPHGRDLHPAVPHLIDAMRAAGVSRLVWVSSHSIGDSHGHSGLLFERLVVPIGRLRAEFADKERQEALVAASDLDWTIVRPARLTNTPATGRVRAAPRLRLSIRDSISRADVAQFIIGEVDSGEHILTAPTITTDRRSRPARSRWRRPARQPVR
jgi:putative NADH-flavin reductase